MRADLAETRLQVDGLRVEMAASTAGVGAATQDKADIQDKLEMALAEQERIKFHAELYRVRIALLPFCQDICRLLFEERPAQDGGMKLGDGPAWR